MDTQEGACQRLSEWESEIRLVREESEQERRCVESRGGERELRKRGWGQRGVGESLWKWRARVDIQEWVERPCSPQRAVWFGPFQPDCRLQLQSQALSEPAWLYALLLITPTHNRSAVQHSAQNIDVCGACGGDHAKQIALGGISQALCGMNPAVILLFIGMANM